MAQTSKLVHMATALVTGGTSGIGLAFAGELAERGYDLVLAARDADRLAETVADLTDRFGRQVEAFQVDLAVRSEVDRLVERLTDQHRPIEVLVNNAGFGLNTPLVGTDVELQDRAIEVMCRAVLVCSGAAAEAMRSRGRGMIINVSSLSAWIYKGNYSAIKRWVLSYTQALALELARTGVQATVVCPSWVKTELHERAGVKRPRLPGWAWVEATEVARVALDTASRGKVVAIPGRGWRVAVWALRHAPDALPRFFSRRISKSRSN